MESWAFSGSGGVVLCCSSTRHRRFIDDLVNVMALPSGGRVRLRYGIEVCDPLIRALGEMVPPYECGKLSALIVHAKFGNDGAEFLPLRSGSIAEIKTEGSVTYLEIELGDFVEQPLGTSFAEVLPQYASIDLPRLTEGKDLPDGFFCQKLASAPPLTCGAGTIVWERVAGRFLSAIDQSNADFPFIFHIELLHSRSAANTALPRKGGVFVAPAISRLELRMRTLAKRSSFDAVIQKPVGVLAVSVDHSECRLASRANYNIDTTRNLLSARITTHLGLRPAYGVLTVVATRGRPMSEEGGPRGALTNHPELVDEVIVELPIAVGTPRIRLAAAGSLALAAAAHEFELLEYGDHPEAVWLKAGLVFLLIFAALWLGLKPQGGG